MTTNKTTLIALIITTVINILLTAYLSKEKKNNQLKKIFIFSLSILIFWTIGLIMQITLSKPLNIEPIYFDYFINMFYTSSSILYGINICKYKN